MFKVGDKVKLRESSLYTGFATYLGPLNLPGIIEEADDSNVVAVRFDDGKLRFQYISELEYANNGLDRAAGRIK